MKKLMKHFSVLALVLTLLLSCMLPVSAAETLIAKDITNVPQYTDLNGNPVAAPVLPAPATSDTPEIQPFAIVKAPYRYIPASGTYNDRAFYLGSSFGYNNLSYQSTLTITYEFRQNVTKESEISGGIAVSGEVELVLSTVKGEVSGSLAKSVTYEKGTTISGSVTVPAGKRATLKFYNAGFYSGGEMVYYVRDTSSGVQYEERKPIGALMPFLTDYGFVAE